MTDEQTILHALDEIDAVEHPAYSDVIVPAREAVRRLVARAEGQEDAIAELLAKNAALTESLAATSDALSAARRERDEAIRLCERAQNATEMALDQRDTLLGRVAALEAALRKIAEYEWHPGQPVTDVKAIASAALAQPAEEGTA